jgi:hypothetical protein
MQLCVFSALSQIGGETALKVLRSVEVGKLSPYTKHFYDSSLKVTEASVRRP